MAQERSRPRPLSWLATKSVEAVDLDEVIAEMDLDALLQGVDIDALVQRIDIDTLVQRIDIDTLVQKIDIDTLVQKIDIDTLVQKIDIDAVVQQIDLDTLLANVDVNAVVDRIDVDRVLDRVDVPELVDRAGIADIVQESTGAVAGSVLDIVRRTLVGVDAIMESTTYRLLRRDPATRPAGPPAIVHADPDLQAREGEVTGRYAGPVSRVAAFGLDFAIIFWSFTLGSAGLAWVLESIGVAIPEWVTSPLAGFITFWLWFFVYWWIGLSLTGRTIGKGIMGLRVVQVDGDPVTGGEAALRTLVMPLSFATFFVGVIIVLVSPRRRTLHDWAARTCEVYDWGDRPAELPAPLTAWVARREAAMGIEEP
jgi:uncharacterized RDD family membrane protein YckC